MTLKDRALTQALAGTFDKEDLTRVMKGIDIIGDIAIIKLPKGWEDRGHKVGELLLERLAHVKGVFRQAAPACSGLRIRELEWLAGKKNTKTTYREHNCTFRLDVSKVYFSPRLSYERIRIARLGRRGETVVNMFAGIGTFSVVMAKLSGSRLIYSIDKNEDAFNYMVENVRLNGLEGVVIPMLGDAGEKASELKGVADRVLMPLPELAYEYLQYGVGSLQEKGGFIHVYTHQQAKSRREAAKIAKEGAKREASKYCLVKNVDARIVRSVGRRLYQAVADIELR